MKVTAVETLACDAGWRNYHFVKLTTDTGIVGWSEFDEGFGSPGVGRVIERLAQPRRRPGGRAARAHLRRALLPTRPAAGGVVAQAMGAIENALLDAKAKALGVPCYELLGGKIRDRIRGVLVALRDLADQPPDLLQAGHHRSRRRQGDRPRGAREGLHAR